MLVDSGYLHLAVGQTFPGTGFLSEHSMKKTFWLNILVSTSTAIMMRGQGIRSYNERNMSST
jgi:hypothetical protein